MTQVYLAAVKKVRGPKVVPNIPSAALVMKEMDNTPSLMEIRWF